MLPKFIREQRKKLRLTQASLGKRTNTSQAFVNKLEHGSPVPLDKVSEWSKALNLTEEEAREFEGLCLAAQSSDLAKSMAKQIAELMARVRLLEATVEPARILMQPLSGPFEEAVARWACANPQAVVKMLSAALSANAHLAFYLKDNQSPFIQKITRFLEAVNPQPSDVHDALQILDQRFGKTPVPQRHTSP